MARPRGKNSIFNPELLAKVTQDYHSGRFTALQISKKYGINLNTLRTRLSKEGISTEKRISRETLKLTAQQHAEVVARERAEVAGWLQNRVIDDMSKVINHLREQIDFCDVKDTKDLTDGYRVAVGEIRKALGLTDEQSASGPKTLVQIQCVGEVSVSDPASEPGIRPLPQLPDFSSIIPAKKQG